MGEIVLCLDTFLGDPRIVHETPEGFFPLIEGLVESAPAEMEDWDLPAAYEALARAHWVAGDPDESRRYLELGREVTARIEDDDDRKLLEADFSTIHP